MVFQFPDNLHPDCAPVAWMLGTWGGRGHGDYPTIDKHEFGQELVFAHDGRAFFHYFARSWVIDEQGEKIAEGDLETGFLRCFPGGKLELLLTHPTGYIEIYYGEADSGRVDLATDAVVRSDTAEEYVAGRRLYGNVESDLLYAYDLAAMGEPLQPRTWARLQRQ